MKQINVTFKNVRKKLEDWQKNNIGSQLLGQWGQRNSIGQIVSGVELSTQQETIPMFPQQERFMALNPDTFSPKEYPSLLWIGNIRFFEERRWVIGRNERFYVAFDVSQNVERQEWLLYMSLFLWLIASGWSFIFGRLFVRRSLRDLHILVKKLNHRSLDWTNPTLIASHLPANDEINSIATAITGLEHRVFAHYQNLRTFVSHVSHELKTPLMVMRSDIDLADRTKNYENAVPSLRTNILDMQHIIETLLTLSRLQAQENIETTPVSLYDIVNDTTIALQKKYNDKHITYTINTTTEKEIIIPANEHLIKILCGNLLDNAWKYSKNNEQIDIHLSNEQIIIKNPGKISEETIVQMREPFWQSDKNRSDGIGIWLSIVQNIARIHKRHISYKSIDDKVICTVDLQQAKIMKDQYNSKN